jgi:hypothetical protein
MHTTFHDTTLTILRYVLDEQQRDLTLFQHRLKRANVGASPSAVASFLNRIDELTAVVADFEELLRLIEQANAEAAEEDRLAEAADDAMSSSETFEHDQADEAALDAADAVRWADEAEIGVAL